MSLKLGQKGAFLMLEKYLTRIRRLKSRCLRGMFTSRLKDTDSILFYCIVKITYDFFFLFSSIGYLYLLTPLSYMYYFLHSQLFF